MRSNRRTSLRATKSDREIEDSARRAKLPPRSRDRNVARGGRVAVSAVQVAANDAVIVDRVVTPLTITILRLPEVCRVTGLSRAMIYRLQARGSFPQSINVTDHAVGWIASEIEGWLLERAAASRGTASAVAPSGPRTLARVARRRLR